MSTNFNPIQAPPGGFNFGGGPTNPTSDAPTLHPDASRTAQEPPRVPPNTASSKFHEGDMGAPMQSSTTQHVPHATQAPQERVSPMDIARATVSAQKADINATTNPAANRAARKEADLVNSGHMPGLDRVQADNERERQPGEESATGSKIHHKTLLGRLAHWEHNGMSND